MLRKDSSGNTISIFLIFTVLNVFKKISTTKFTILFWSSHFISATKYWYFNGSRIFSNIVSSPYLNSSFFSTAILVSLWKNHVRILQFWKRIQGKTPWNWSLNRTLDSPKIKPDLYFSFIWILRLTFLHIFRFHSFTDQLRQKHHFRSRTLNWQSFQVDCCRQNKKKRTCVTFIYLSQSPNLTFSKTTCLTSSRMDPIDSFGLV